MGIVIEWPSSTTESSEKEFEFLFKDRERQEDKTEA